MRHIFITNPEDCCGCSACRCICPVNCISMAPDSKGFLYPRVDEKVCIECGACVKVCPFINVNSERKPKECLAAINTDGHERLASSSGGIFILLAKYIISRGGVVYGAVFDDNLNVCHHRADSLEEVYPMMTSKYVQSDTGGVHRDVRKRLLEGRKVLFTGTQCQIAGLKHYLGKEYEELYAVEVTCHGVPSPLIWKNYVSSLNLGDVKGCNFRHKKYGWRLYTLVFDCGRNGKESSRDIVWADNLYGVAFRRNYSLRPSCFNCKAKGGRSGADLTLGDFWGVEQFGGRPHDDKGVSGIMVWSLKGKALLDSLSDIDIESAEYKDLVKGNSSYFESASKPADIDKFWAVYLTKGLAKACASVGIYSVVRQFLRRIKRMLLK